VARVAGARAGGTITVSLGGTRLEVLVRGQSICLVAGSKGKSFCLFGSDFGESSLQTELELLATLIKPLGATDVEHFTGLHRFVLGLGTSDVVVRDNLASQGILLTGVGGVGELDSVQRGSGRARASAFHNTLHLVDFDLWNSKVRQIHESVLNLRA